MRELERRVVLQVIDRRWRDHLYEMDYLKDGIGLRAMAHRDPLVEYQREGYSMFQQMMGQIREESVGYLFNLEVEVKKGASEEVTSVEAKGLTRPDGEEEKLSYSAATESGDVEVRNQKGQIEKAATARAKQATAARNAPAAPEAPAAPAERGAFGQKGATVPPVAGNRADRRAQGKKK
jgi:preprotein translocase subunit SecA